MRHPEDNLQQMCVQWFRLQYPDRIIFHVPNGAKRTRFQGARLRNIGLTKGIPDLCVPEPMSPFNGMFIELKAPKNKPTAEQAEMLTRLSLRGYKTTWCNSFEDFKFKIENYFNNRK